MLGSRVMAGISNQRGQGLLPEHGDEEIDQQDVGHQQEDDKKEHHQPVGVQGDAVATLGPGGARPQALLR